jgi:hypothetical protein
MQNVGKGITIARGKVANDAKRRLRGIIDRLVVSGVHGREAEFRAKNSNRELWAMAQGAPDDSESESVDSSNYLPRRQRALRPTR